MQIEPHRIEIEQAKTGSEQAMHHLYQAYSKAMLNTAHRIVNNRDDAQDVLQDSFTKAFMNLNQFQFQSSFGAWLKRIVVNRSIDVLRKSRKEALLLEEMAFGNTFFEEPEEPFLKKNITLLFEALHALPDGYRTVFSLYILEGYDHKEIAQILNIKESTSISQLSRAKRKLKSLITIN